LVKIGRHNRERFRPAIKLDRGNVAQECHEVVTQLWVYRASGHD
jgi:hypothetical protein